MKRKILLMMITVITTMVIVTGCENEQDRIDAENKEIAVSVNELILSGSDVESILSAYSELTEEQKEYVSAYEDIEAALAFNDLIEAMDLDSIPSQSEYDSLVEEYSKLSDEQRKYVTSKEIIDKYADIDLKEVGRLAEKINEITSTTSFTEILDINEDVLKLTNAERQLLDTTKIDSALELTDEDRAALAAISYVKKALKDPSSFQLIDATVVNDINGSSKYYLVYLNYSAQNGFGGTNNEYSFQTISDDFINPWFALAVLGGDYSTALKCDSFYKFYSSGDRIRCDIDKLMYNAN